MALTSVGNERNNVCIHYEKYNHLPIYFAIFQPSTEHKTAISWIKSEVFFCATNDNKKNWHSVFVGSTCLPRPYSSPSNFLPQKINESVKKYIYHSAFLCYYSTRWHSKQHISQKAINKKAIHKLSFNDRFPSSGSNRFCCVQSASNLVAVTLAANPFLKKVLLPTVLP